MTSEPNREITHNTSSQIGLMLCKRGFASIKIYHTPKVLSISRSADEIILTFKGYRRIDIQQFYAAIAVPVYVRQHTSSGGGDILKLGAIDFYAVNNVSNQECSSSECCPFVFAYP